jgi:hypothetical protein
MDNRSHGTLVSVDAKEEQAMRSSLAIVLATSCSVWPAYSFAEDAATQLVGTWKLVSWLTKFDGGDTVEPYGPNSKGRLVLTPDRQGDKLTLRTPEIVSAVRPGQKAVGTITFEREHWNSNVSSSVRS